MRALLKNLFFRLVMALVKRRDARNRESIGFPTSQGRNYLFEPLFPKADGTGYFTKYYLDAVENPLAIDFKRFKLEIVRGRRCPKGHPHQFDLDAPSAIPCAITNVSIVNGVGPTGGPNSLRLRTNGEDHHFRGLVGERFYYLPVRQTGAVEIRSDHDLIVGEPIPLVQRKRHKRKLVLTIFVDTFSWEIFDHISFEKDLPNIHRFFSKGTIFDRAYSASNWTVPGVASIYSGKTLKNHGMFHPRRDIVLGSDYPIISELFQADGYLTFQACGNWRKSPSYGYAKGFDRTVYKNRMTLGEVLDAYLDHMRAFPDRDQFAWLSIFDPHTRVSLTHEVAVQTAVPLAYHDYEDQEAKTPEQMIRDPARFSRYLEELKRVDFYLGRVFSFLEQRYADDEMLVCLVSDHGTSYASEDNQMLAREKTHVAFMIRGGGIPAGRTGEFVHATDILPTLLQFADVPFDGATDGRVPQALGGPSERDFVVSEIRFPGTTFKAAIKDDEFDFYFESEGLTGDDGAVEVGAFKTALFRKDDFTTDVSRDHPEVVKRYERTVLEYLRP